jgi:hypothetical protein
MIAALALTLAPLSARAQGSLQIKSLGTAGQHAQAYLPPDKEPKQPYNQAPRPPK